MHTDSDSNHAVDQGLKIYIQHQLAADPTLERWLDDIKGEISRAWEVAAGRM